MLKLPDAMHRYSLRITESTIKNIRALNGVLVQIAKPLGALPYLLHTAKLSGRCLRILLSLITQSRNIRRPYYARTAQSKF